MRAPGPKDVDPPIESLLRGDPDTLRIIDRWIDVVLRSGAARAFRDDWDDLRQEIRIRVLSNALDGRFDRRSSLRTYVHSIARNVCIDFARAGWRRSRLKHESAGLAKEPTRSGLPGSIARDLIVKLLEGFSEDERRLLNLVFVEGCSYDEVARRLGVPAGTVKSRMSRCKERLLRRRRELSELE